jgi:hypothetical protein
MFEDALKTSGYEGKFIVRELIELINECIDYPIETEVFAHTEPEEIPLVSE